MACHRSITDMYVDQRWGFPPQQTLKCHQAASTNMNAGTGSSPPLQWVELTDLNMTIYTNQRERCWGALDLKPIKTKTAAAMYVTVITNALCNNSPCHLPTIWQWSAGSVIKLAGRLQQRLNTNFGFISIKTPLRERKTKNRCQGTWEAQEQQPIEPNGRQLYLEHKTISAFSS